MRPHLVSRVWASLTTDPMSGRVLAECMGQPLESVYEALVWMEARGYACLRPSELGPRRGSYSTCGWVPGRNSMRKAA